MEVALQMHAKLLYFDLHVLDLDLPFIEPSEVFAPAYFVREC